MKASAFGHQMLEPELAKILFQRVVLDTAGHFHNAVHIIGRSPFRR